MKKMVKLILDQDIIDKYLGVPYREGGRDTSGLDCWGLVIAVYADMGHQLLDFDRLPENYRNGFYRLGNVWLENFYKEWQRLGLCESPDTYDLVMFQDKSRRKVNHCGLIIDNERFLQTARAGTILTPFYRFDRPIEGFYRYLRLENNGHN